MADSITPLLWEHLHFSLFSRATCCNTNSKSHQTMRQGITHNVFIWHCSKEGRREGGRKKGGREGGRALWHCIRRVKEREKGGTKGGGEERKEGEGERTRAMVTTVFSVLQVTSSSLGARLAGAQHTAAFLLPSSAELSTSDRLL